MIIEIRSSGSSSRYSVDFSREDVKSLEEFLSSKDVFLSDKQVKNFVENGEGVKFERISGTFVPFVVVIDITEQYMKDKARDLVRKFSNGVTINPFSKTLISRALKVKKVAVSYGLEDML